MSHFSLKGKTKSLFTVTHKGKNFDFSIGKTRVRASAMVSECYHETIGRSWEDFTSKRQTQDVCFGYIEYKQQDEIFNRRAKNKPYFVEK